MIEINTLQLGSDSDRIKLDTAEDNRIAAVNLARQAKRSIDIFTWDLDGEIYDNNDFVKAVKELAIRNKHTLIRILIQDSTKASKQGHRLPYLSHRLPSKVKIRKPSSEYIEYRKAFLIADGIGIIKRPSANRFEGELYFKSPIEAKEAQNFFNKVWESAGTDPYLRRLDI